MNKTFPTLYKKASTGKIQQWTIAVAGNTIITEWGQLHGSLQTTSDIISEGKNIGRSNETTPEEQAMKEAESQWEKKLKKDYVKTIEDAKSGASSDLVKGGILPLLAQKYSEQGHKIKFPCFAQRKLDGHRCIAVVKGGKCTLWSRTRKPITSMPHIVSEIESLSASLHLDDIILDGELYNHDYRDNFEAITSLIRPTKPKPDHTLVEYHVYDLVITDLRYADRYYRLAKIFNDGHELGLVKYLVEVETVAVKDEDEMLAAFESFLDAGYEGLMVRNCDGMYVYNKRSPDLQKVKKFDDDEFEVVGVNEGRGKLAGHAVFACETDKGVPFDAKMRGPIAELKKYWDNPELIVGKKITVQYQGFTKAGKPRFAVAHRIREDYDD